MSRIKRGVIVAWTGVGSHLVGTVHCSDGSIISTPRDAWCEPVLDEYGVFVAFGRSMEPRCRGQAWPKHPPASEFDKSVDPKQPRLYVFAVVGRKRSTTAVRWAVVSISPPKPPRTRPYHQTRELILDGHVS